MDERHFSASEGLTKAYPGVVANDDVSFDIAPGEVHALLGENGAGKSTLVKMIYGLVKPDAGAMTLDGAALCARPSPRGARAAGVAMVFQHFSLFEALTVAENVALGMENPPKLRELRAAHPRGVGDLRPAARPRPRWSASCRPGERQRVEIIRCLLQDPQLLIMDEPTIVLTPQEVEILFATLRKLQAEGTAILYISPQAGGDPRRSATRATILRLGKVVATCDPRRDLRARAGRDDGGQRACRARGARPRAPGEVVLEVDGPVAARARRLRHAAARHVASRCARARCWASAASRATGRTSCWRRSRARRLSPPGTVRAEGRRRSAATGPNARRDGWAPARRPRSGWAMPRRPT